MNNSNNKFIKKDLTCDIILQTYEYFRLAFQFLERIRRFVVIYFIDGTLMLTNFIYFAQYFSNYDRANLLDDSYRLSRYRKIPFYK